MGMKKQNRLSSPLWDNELAQGYNIHGTGGGKGPPAREKCVRGRGGGRSWDNLLRGEAGLLKSVPRGDSVGRRKLPSFRRCRTRLKGELIAGLKCNAAASSGPLRKLKKAVGETPLARYQTTNKESS